jgi:outer membrane protein assembly factor BamB
MGEMGALDLETGQRLWRREPKEPLIHQPPPVPIGDLAVLVADGIIHAANAADGSRRWDFTLPSAIGLVVVPTVYGGQIFLHTGPTLIALDSSGRRIWTWKTPEEDTLGNPMRVTVFKDGVLLHDSGAVICYGMTRAGAGDSGATRANL